MKNFKVCLLRDGEIRTTIFFEKRTVAKAAASVNVFGIVDGTNGDDLEFSFPFDVSKPENTCDMYTINNTDPVYTIKEKISLYTGINTWEQHLFTLVGGQLMVLGYEINLGAIMPDIRKKEPEEQSQIFKIRPTEFWDDNQFAMYPPDDNTIFLVSIPDYFNAEAVRRIRDILTMDDSNSQMFISRVIWRYWPHLYSFELVHDYFLMEEEPFKEKHLAYISAPSRKYIYTHNFPVFLADPSSRPPAVINSAIISAVLSSVTLENFIPFTNSTKNLRTVFENINIGSQIASAVLVLSKQDMNFTIPHEFVRVIKYDGSATKIASLTRPGTLRLLVRVRTEELPQCLRDKLVGSRNIDIDLTKNGAVHMATKWEEQYQIGISDITSLATESINRILTGIEGFPIFDTNSKKPYQSTISSLIFRIKLMNSTKFRWETLKNSVLNLISIGMFVSSPDILLNDNQVGVIYMSNAGNRHGTNMSQKFSEFLQESPALTNGYSFFVKEERKDAFVKWYSSGPTIIFDFNHNEKSIEAECKNVSTEQEYHRLSNFIRELFTSIVDIDTHLQSKAIEAEPAETQTNPKALSQIDRITFGVTIGLDGKFIRYSRYCEGADHQVMPVINEESLSEKLKKRIFRLKNLEYGGTQAYYCPSDEFPHVQLKHVSTHPLGICFPCCAKKEMSPAGAKWPQQEACIKKMFADSGKYIKVGESFEKEVAAQAQLRKAVLRFSDIRLAQGRRMALPRNLSEFFGTKNGYILGTAATSGTPTDLLSSFVESLTNLAPKALAKTLFEGELNVNRIMFRLEEHKFVPVILELGFNGTLSASVPQIYQRNLEYYINLLGTHDPMFFIRNIDGAYCPIILDESAENIGLIDHSAIRYNCVTLFNHVRDISMQTLSKRQSNEPLLTTQDIRTLIPDSIYEYLGDVAMGENIIGSFLKYREKDDKLFVQTAKNSCITSSAAPLQFSMSMLGTRHNLAKFVRTHMVGCVIGLQVMDTEKHIGFEIHETTNRHIRKIMYCAASYPLEEIQAMPHLTIPIRLEDILRSPDGVIPEDKENKQMPISDNEIYAAFKAVLFSAIRGTDAKRIAMRKEVGRGQVTGTVPAGDLEKLEEQAKVKRNMLYEFDSDYILSQTELKYDTVHAFNIGKLIRAGNSPNVIEYLVKENIVRVGDPFDMNLYMRSDNNQIRVADLIVATEAQLTMFLEKIRFAFSDYSDEEIAYSIIYASNFADVTLFKTSPLQNNPSQKEVIRFESLDR